MAQVTAIINRIVMDENYHVSFYNQFGYVAQVLETDVFIEISGDYLVCGSNGDSIRFFANTVTSIEGPTFSQSYTPITAGFYQQGSQYFERLTELYDFINTNIVSVVIRNITALKFADGTTQTTAATGGGGGGTVTSVATSSPLTGGPITTTGTIGITQANSTTDGYLSSTNWNTFNSKEPGITPGTTSQYWRGDKSWQTLDKNAVGLGNVDNTSDANKPISTATQTALNAKQDTLSGTGVVKSTGGTISYISGTSSEYIKGDGTLGTLPTTGGGIPHGIAAASTENVYTTSITGVTAYNDADAYLIRFTTGNTSTCTLQINTLAAVPLYRNNDGELIGGDIIDGAEMLCIYNSTTSRFQVIGTAPNTLLAYVTNADTVAITKGQPVYAFGGQGDRLTVKRAYNTGDATSAQTVGLVLSTSIGVNQKGLIILNGQLDGLGLFKPSNGWLDGDAVYLGDTPGSVTRVKPHAPNHLVYLGFVTTANNGNAGRMYVRVQNGYEMDEIHDVVAQNPNNNDGLFFNTSNSLWESKSIAVALGYTPGQGTVTSVSALTLGTTGTDLSSSVATGTTTPVITLNVPTASATNRGALSSGDWSKFNGKQDVITLTTTGTSGAATFIGDTLNIPQYSGGSSGSDQVLTFQIASTINASTTNYLNTGVTNTTIENAATMIAPVAFTLSNMYTVHYTSTQPASGAQVLTVRKNGVDTALSITIAAGSAPTTTPYSDLTNSVSFAVGDRMTIKRQNLATAAGGAVSGISLKLTI